MGHGAFALPSADERFDETEACDEIRRRDDEDVAQPVAISRARGGVGRGGIEQGERIEHVRFAARLATELLEERARLCGAIGQRIDPRERESDVGVGRVELARAVELLLGVGVASRLEVGEAEVGEAERIVRGELGELLELRFGLAELIALEVAHAKHARAVQLLDRGSLAFAGAERDERRDGECGAERGGHWRNMRRSGAAGQRGACRKGSGSERFPRPWPRPPPPHGEEGPPGGLAAAPSPAAPSAPHHAVNTIFSQWSSLLLKILYPSAAW